MGRGFDDRAGLRILLWDIDGTLVSTGGAGLRALADAVGARPAAVEALRRMRLDGMTDRKIARALCAAHAHAQDPSLSLEEHSNAVPQAEIDRVLSHYVAALREYMRAPQRYTILAGVQAALRELEPRRDVLLALGTGNLEEGARLKLEHGDLWRFFRFGGYGSDAEERPDILRAAWRRAEAYLGRRCTPEEFTVIGDTPRDVSAAHEVGFPCVAVASGRHSVAELAGSGADAVLSSVDAPGALEVILTVARPSGSGAPAAS